MANNNISNNHQIETISINSHRIFINILPIKCRINNNISNIECQNININSSEANIYYYNNFNIIYNRDRIEELQQQINRINNEINNFKNDVENINMRNESFNSAFKSFLEAINNINNNDRNAKNENLNKSTWPESGANTIILPFGPASQHGLN